MRALQKGATRRHSVLVRALGHADCPNLYSRNPADIRADRRQCAALGCAIRLRRAMTATWAAGVISRRCAPVTRRSRPR